MSGVVLRCPNCGTVRASPGECEACSEAQVRYFCTNHAPGRWIDVPACPQCGARLGEVPAPAAARPKPASPVSAPSPGRRRVPPADTAAPEAAEPPRRGIPTSWPKAGRSPWGPAERPPTVPDPRLGMPREAAPRRMTLPEMMMAAARRRRVPDRYDPPHETRMEGSPIIGSVRRLGRMLLFFVIGLLVLGLFSGGSLLDIILHLLLASSR